MKKFILGFLIGAFMFSGAAYAASELNVIPNPFPVLINGTEKAVEGYNINGYTFLKLADFKQAGLTIKFNETDKQIEVTSNQAPVANMPVTKPEKEVDTVSEQPESKTVTAPVSMPTDRLEEGMEWVWNSDIEDWGITYNGCLYLNDILANYFYRYKYTQIAADPGKSYKYQPVIEYEGKHYLYNREDKSQFMLVGSTRYINVTWLTGN